MIRPENRNILWATILVDELARAGVRHAVICPGSRSTPLAVAFSRDDRFKIHTIIDERAAAFFALGIGKAAGMPAVVVCTSGTAAANFFPAIIEASMSNVPMIVMTADRPHELRDSGANQTIDQVKLYGGYVRWFVDVAPPYANPEDKTLRYLRTTVDRAVAVAKGIAGKVYGIESFLDGGPVHLNVPFEKPLEPVVIAGDNTFEITNSRNDPDSLYKPQTSVRKGIREVNYRQIEGMEAALFETAQGIIVCGSDTPESAAYEVAELAKTLDYPVLVESGSRFFAWSEFGNDYHLIGGYETFLQGDFATAITPNLILQIGSLPIGASLLSYLAKQVSAYRIIVTPSDNWVDDSHLASKVIIADPALLIRSLNLEIKRIIGNGGVPAVDPTWLKQFLIAEAKTWEAIDEVTKYEAIEAGVLRDVANCMSNGALFVANSNPVRHFDQFVRPQPKHIHLFLNRGVSGIDGTVASALGVACGKLRQFEPTVLVIGDTALYHDLNSLHLIRRLGIPLIIVCINNDGGGIFHRLPIAQHEPPFRDLFVMPHGLTFEHAAQMFDIPYTLAQMGEEFRTAFKAALDAGGPALIEVPSDAAKFEQQRKQLIETVAQRIKESGILEKFKASQEKH